jgi:3-methylfumaryl-CoA hydratase
MDQHVTDWIGRSITRTDVVTERIIGEYRAALSPWLFETSDDACPPGLHFGLAPALPSFQDTGPDGAERMGLFLPPIELPRRMWAGGSIETFRSLLLGDVVQRISRVASIRFTRGNTGELCLMSILHDIMVDDMLAIRERQDLVFREAASGPAPDSVPDEALVADVMIEASPLLLFRFSAFTFNGHRIHYDQAYARAEGYPNVLVHGPLQAVLMLNLASRRLGAVPRQFHYRCLAPLYGGSCFGVKFEAAGAKTRIIRRDGITAAEGQAHAPETG